MAELTAGQEFKPDRRDPGPLELFLYSASVGIPHRIHYDTQYAKSEGHKDILVHGPLQAICMVQNAVKGLGPDWRVTNIHFRNLSTVVVGTPFICSSRVAEASADSAVIEISSRSEDGETLFTTGEVTAEKVARA